MAAYMIAEVVEISDLPAFRRYNSVVPDTIAAHGGRFLVRGGEVSTVEGEWRPGRLVIVEFDDMESLQRWYTSPEYQAVQPVRARSARSNVVFVDGAADDRGTGGAA